MEDLKVNEEVSQEVILTQVLDLTSPLPDMAKAEVIAYDLTSDYWSPEEKGESKRLIFTKIGVAPVLDQDSGDIIDLECAFFFEQDPQTKEIRQVRQGSKRLVGAMVANNIKYGTPLQITFMGKKQNRSNANKSDTWSIKPLRINI